MSFPLIQAGEGVWQCRYSCILRAPKLRPPIWIQAFQIVKWHSSFLREAGSVARFLLGLKKCLFSPSLITLSLLTLTPSPSYFLHLFPPLVVYPHSPPFLVQLLIASLSLSLSSYVLKSCSLRRRAPVTAPLLLSCHCPRAPTPTSLLPLGNPKKGQHHHRVWN